jgi:hypothetical protein
LAVRDTRFARHRLAGIDALAAAIDALAQPLSDAEREFGWTDRSREHWIAFLEGLSQGIRVATYPERAAVLKHLEAWLSHDGIDARSPLAGRLAEAQADLHERFAKHQY